MELVYFQTPDIDPEYCEVGVIHSTDKYYIHGLDEPCKVLISEVKVIPKNKVKYDKKSGLYHVKN